MIADRSAVTHLEIECVVVGFHLFEGWENVDLCVPACPIAAYANHFTDAFVVSQLIHLDTHVTGLDTIATYKTDGRERDN